MDSVVLLEDNKYGDASILGCGVMGIAGFHTRRKTIGLKRQLFDKKSWLSM